MIIHGDYQNFQNDKFRAGLDNVKQIDKLCNKKASQNTDIPVKIIKENEDLIPYFYITILATDYLSYCHDTKQDTRKTIKLTKKIIGR